MGRQSSVDRLPPDIREQLLALLRDKRVTQLEATRRINEILEDEGHAERLSKSAAKMNEERDQAIRAEERELAAAERCDFETTPFPCACGL